MTRVAIFGAAPDTMNMGVSALLASMLDGLSQRIPSLEFIVFDNKLGFRKSAIRVSEDRTIPVSLAGARSGNRFYLPENLGTMKLAAQLGGPFPLVHPTLRLLRTCSAILNISGGDSFSDIYGPVRFGAIARPMQIAKALGIPLILPPQTYGPYNDPGIRQTASTAVRDAAVCWARDLRSFGILKDLLGKEFDPYKHQCGVDVAFGLSRRDASDALPDNLRSWISTSAKMVGINVNGLIYLDPRKATDRYRFKADYRKSVADFATWVLENTDHNVVFVPHVMQPFGNYESDGEASYAVMKALPEEFSDRVAVTPMDLDQCQTKWVIGHMDWFCGTRMHSTIAGLSTGVPTSSIVYSDKASGVFASCRQEAHALDPRVLNTAEIVEGLKASFLNREEARLSLSKALPEVLSVIDRQMESIATCITSASVKSIGAKD